jgi:cytochrome c biogenesis protein CcdA
VLELLLETATELFDELVVATELELGTELFELEEVVATELLVVVEHTAPVIVGFSAGAVLFLSPCTPKLTDWPG